MSRLNELFICDKCHGENTPVEVDNGGYEEVWGRKMWVSAYEMESGCCRKAEAFSIAQFIENGWPLPEWAQEVVSEEEENA